MIKKLVDTERKEKPLSDNRITSLLGAQGINVARRTVAKYREALNIPSSSERKRLF
jgi:RNA polymerase sigma-54 factor